MTFLFCQLSDETNKLRVSFKRTVTFQNLTSSDIGVEQILYQEGTTTRVYLNNYSFVIIFAIAIKNSAGDWSNNGVTLLWYAQTNYNVVFNTTQYFNIEIYNSHIKLREFNNCPYGIHLQIGTK